MTDNTSSKMKNTTPMEVEMKIEENEKVSPFTVVEVIYPKSYVGKVWDIDPHKDRSEKIISANRKRFKM